MMIPGLDGLLDDLWWEASCPTLAQQIAFIDAHPTPPEPVIPEPLPPPAPVEPRPSRLQAKRSNSFDPQSLVGELILAPMTPQMSAIEAGHRINPANSRCLDCSWTVSQLSMIEPTILASRCPPGPLLGS